MTRRSVSTPQGRISYLDEGSGPPVLVLHGFTGSAESMRPIIDTLSSARRVIAPDLPGHGHTAASDDVAWYSTDSTISHLDAILEATGIVNASVVGYSLGGRLGLSFACAHPASVNAMALIGTTAGIEDAVERAERKASDEALADRIEAHGVEAFVDYWEQLPIFATQRGLSAPRRAAIRAVRCSHAKTGLANSLRGIGAGVMPPVWDRVGTLDATVRLVVGSLDARYLEQAQRLSGLLRHGHVTVVPGAGHAPHVEDPVATLAAISGAV